MAARNAWVKGRWLRVFSVMVIPDPFSSSIAYRAGVETANLLSDRHGRALAPPPKVLPGPLLDLHRVRPHRPEGRHLRAVRPPQDREVPFGQLVQRVAGGEVEAPGLAGSVAVSHRHPFPRSPTPGKYSP